MKKILTLSITLALASSLVGCVVAPARVEPVGVYVPPGVVYTAPVYPMPAPGYTWRYHEHYGWGWYHPQYGWHRGWR